VSPENLEHRKTDGVTSRISPQVISR